MARDERRPFGLGLLHAVFAEDALAGGDDRLDRFGAERLRHRHQRDCRRIASGVAAGARDFLAHRRNGVLPVQVCAHFGGFHRGFHRGFHVVNDHTTV